MPSERPARQPQGEPPIRVMVVDDSIVARTIVQSILDPIPDIKVVATASTAEQALASAAGQPVDVVLLDLALPGIDGLTALPALLERSRGARVLVLSASAAVGARACVEALTLGAADTLEKPTSGFAGAFSEALVDKLRRIGRAAPATDGATAIPSFVRRPPVPGEIGCVAIAASTGGPHALRPFLAALPPALVAPILVTQHLPPSFMSVFANQLAAISGRPAKVARAGDPVRDGEILVAPGDGHLLVAGERGSVHVAIGSGRTSSGCLPSADPMLSAVAGVYGAGAFAVVLTGMGRDGLIGAQRIVDAGGEVAAQDRATSVVWGMPGVVAAAGLAAVVATPEAIAARIAHRVAAETGPRPQQHAW